MKKIIFTLFCILISLTAYGNSCNVTCPSETMKVIEDENVFLKVTGINFLTKKIVETAIEKELKDELNSKFNADLDIFTLKRLKSGEFKNLLLISDNFRYRAMSISDFKAETICPYNQIIYKNKKVYYPNDLPFKFNANITNNDIKNIIKSKEFQKQIQRSAVKINGFTTLEVQEPIVTIKNGQLEFSIPIRTFLSNEPFIMNLNSNIEVANNKIMLKDTTFSTNSNIINIDILGGIINQVNPVAFQINSIDSKYCKIYITSAKIEGNIIKTEGIFIINKNYER
ncbi:TPA: hypothetical protein IAA87_06860 [Candidatus Avigastranaerophilus faecigallinarum]|nr:hypothetical protein [Candidatus Avigastranaerophilus faecigallinarum]